MNRRGFTLLELLIVVGILAVLATVAVLVINPTEYLRQSRDAKRIADLMALNKALGIAEFNSLNMGGASTTVFVSLRDTSATCDNLGLPPLPTGYQYRCVTVAANLGKTNGTGWIPVAMNSIAGGAPMSALPIDPVNDKTNFYAYIPGGSFALSATLESGKYAKQAGVNDGGVNPAKIEKGSDLKLLTNAEGLAGYWPFDEGGGTAANDASGNGIDMTLNNGVPWTTGKVAGAANFDGTDDYANANNNINNLTAYTIMAWVRSDALDLVDNFNMVLKTSGMRAYLNRYKPTNKWQFNFYDGSATQRNLYGDDVVTDGEWYHIAGTNNGTNQYLYVNGILQTQTGNFVGIDSASSAITMTYIGSYSPTQYFLDGAVDNAAIYNRALTASEIKAIYDATK